MESCHTIDDCDFEMNTTVYDGAAIYCDWTSMFIIDSTVLDGRLWAVSLSGRKNHN